MDKAVSRRQFLGQLGLTLAAWFPWPSPAKAVENTAPILATPTRRQWALLIGINAYNGRGDWLPLTGCLTDVALIQEVLCARLGFDPSRVLVLSDRQATRPNILAAFREHLGQAQNDDLVWVHFSGHGSRVGEEPTLVPIDSPYPLAGQEVRDIPLTTWKLLLQSVPAATVVSTLDVGYAAVGYPLAGTLRVRSRPSSPNWEIRPEEAELQTQLATALTPAQRYRLPLLLQATDWGPVCWEGLWGAGIASGLFTYALTQQLWQATAGDRPQIWPRMAETFHTAALEVETLPPAFPENIPLPAAPSDGVIQNSDGKTADVWLGGIPPDRLPYVGWLTTPTAQTLMVRSRSGLTVKVEGADNVGTPVYEGGRIIAKTLPLVIALDNDLSRIERVDATSALSSIPHMVAIAPGEQAADVVLGCQAKSYGLFTIHRRPILGSFGAAEESVGAAVRRLRPQLEGLLAAKGLRATVNPEASQIGAIARLMVQTRRRPEPVLCAYQATRPVAARPPLLPYPKLTAGDRLMCTLANTTNDPLYARIVAIDAQGHLFVPPTVVVPYTGTGTVLPHQTLTVPPAESALVWTVGSSPGPVDIYALLSLAPQLRTEALLANRTAPTNPIAIVAALLDDLAAPGTNETQWLLDHRQWATLRLAYRGV
ncbi:MAG: caspase family protein [Pseudanabaenaceae cyanobacterium]